MTTTEIKKHLMIGDMAEIAILAGCSAEYVRKILGSDRPNTTHTTRRVVEIAQRMALARKQIRQQSIADLINGN